MTRCSHGRLVRHFAYQQNEECRFLFRTGTHRALVISALARPVGRVVCDEVAAGLQQDIRKELLVSARVNLDGYMRQTVDTLRGVNTASPGTVWRQYRQERASRDRTVCPDLFRWSVDGPERRRGLSRHCRDAAECDASCRAGRTTRCRGSPLSTARETDGDILMARCCSSALRRFGVPEELRRADE